MRTRGLVLLAATMMAILFVAGCSGSQGTEQASEDQQQKDEELQQREEEVQQREDELAQQREEDLQKQIDDLEAQQEEEPQVVIEDDENGPSTAAPEGVVVVSPDVVVDTDLEASALEAAVSYYQAVEVGDYAYTYDALSSADQDNYTYDQWQYANNTFDNASDEFEVFRALVDSPNTEIVSGYPHVADVGLSIYYSDGSVDTRYTFFVYEGGVWKHWLTAEEMDGFDSVL